LALAWLSDSAGRSEQSTASWRSTLTDLRWWCWRVAFLIAVILWFDNPQGALTGNGISRVGAQALVVDSRSRHALSSNYLFYPVYGALCRVPTGWASSPASHGASSPSSMRERKPLPRRGLT